MAQGSELDLRVLYKNTWGEREQFLSLAQRVAYLTLPQTDPDPGGLQKSGAKNKDVLQNLPANTYGSAAVKGLSAALALTLNPAGIRFFKLDTDPQLQLTDEQQVELDHFFRQQERRIDEYLARHNFPAFSQTAIERVVIEGTNGVNIDPDTGFSLFKLNQLSIDRTGENVNWLIFEQYSNTPDPERASGVKVKSVFTYINKQTGEIWRQHEEADEPTMVTGVYYDEETGELVELDGDNPKYWFVIGTQIPQFHNFAVAFYMEQLSLLEDIENSSLALKNAKRIAGQFFYTLDPQQVGEITPARFSRIRNHEVVPMSHDKVRPWVSGLKLQDWEWLSRKLNEDGQRLLNISAVGIYNRRAAAKTATEIRAIRAELETLIGATAAILAQTFHFSVIEALIDVLEIRKRLAEDPALEGVDKETMDKLVRGIVVTGSPEVARERELEKLQLAVESFIILFKEEAYEEINTRGYMETVFDSLGIKTEGVLNTEKVVEERAAREPPEAEQGTQPPPVPPGPPPLPLGGV